MFEKEDHILGDACVVLVCHFLLNAASTAVRIFWRMLAESWYFIFHLLLPSTAVRTEKLAVTCGE